MIKLSFKDYHAKDYHANLEISSPRKKNKLTIKDKSTYKPIRYNTSYTW